MPRSTIPSRGSRPSTPHTRPRSGESARSLLNTVLGEFAYPAGGAAWTQTLVAALSLLDVEEKAARQALARSAGEGWLQRERDGRRVRWRLTPAGMQRCIDGTARINSFGSARTDWDGQWLLLLVTVPEEQRALGHRLRRRLTWARFGSLGQGTWVTPHVDLEPEASRILSEFRALRPRTQAAAFVAQTRLVHEWRRFAFYDPVLPAELLPANWVGVRAKAFFDEKTAQWLPPAEAWFREAEG